MKHSYKKITSLFLLLVFLPCLIFINGCSGNDRIPEKKLIKIYSDLVISFDTTSEKSNVDSLRQKVLSRYGVTKEEYERSVNWYNRNPKEWSGFFNKVIAHVDSLKNRKN